LGHKNGHKNRPEGLAGSFGSIFAPIFAAQDTFEIQFYPNDGYSPGFINQGKQQKRPFVVLAPSGGYCGGKKSWLLPFQWA
jgi:hypothetical protein